MQHPHPFPPATAAGFEDFVDEVRKETRASSALEAIGTLRAVLETLAECLSGTGAEDMAKSLPSPVADCLHLPEWQGAEMLSLNEFVARVGRREGTTASQAWSHTEAVFRTLARLVPPPESAVLDPAVPPELAALWCSYPSPASLDTAHMHQPIG